MKQNIILIILVTIAVLILSRNLMRRNYSLFNIQLPFGY